MVLHLPSIFPTTFTAVLMLSSDVYDLDDVAGTFTDMKATVPFESRLRFRGLGCWGELGVSRLQPPPSGAVLQLGGRGDWDTGDLSLTWSSSSHSGTDETLSWFSVLGTSGAQSGFAISGSLSVEVMPSIA